LGDLEKQFTLDFKDTNVSKFELVRNPFATNISGAMTCEQEQLIHTSCDGSLKDMIDADKLPQFWPLV
jgi:hypothetical protein